jgi:hypothetical protein
MLASTSILPNLVDLEGVLAIVFIAFSTLAITGGPVFLLLQTLTRNSRLSLVDQCVLAAEVALEVVIQLSAARFVLVALSEARSPRPVYAALRQRFRYSALRMVAGIWWLANALIMIAMGDILLGTVAQNEDLRDHQNWQYIVTAFVIFLGCSYAANTFFLLMLGAFRQRKRILMRIWHFRLLLDVGVSLLAIWGQRYVDVSKVWR